jgi:hypothetical protein
MRAPAITVAALLIGSTVVARAQDVGVPVCDRFLATYESCVMTKAPPAFAGQMRSGIDALRANFRKVAETPEGKSQLEPVCKQTAEDLKTKLAVLNCSW